MYIYTHIHPSIYLSFCSSVCLSVCLSIYLSIYLDPDREKGLARCSCRCGPDWYGRRKILCVEFYTHSFVRIRSNCRGQPWQQRDAQKLISVWDVVLYAPYTGPSSCTLGRRVQHCTPRSMHNIFRLQYDAGFCQKMFLLRKPLPCNPAADIALQPLIGHSESFSSHVYVFSGGVFFPHTPVW